MDGWMDGIYVCVLIIYCSGRFIHVGLHLLNDMLSSFDAAMDTSGKTHDALLKIYMKMLPTVSKQWPEKHPGMCGFL